MNPENEIYKAFVEDVEDCIEEVAEQHGIDADVVVEEGDVTTVAVRGELEGGKQIEVTTLLLANLAQNFEKVGEQLSANPDADPPTSDEVIPRIPFEGGPSARSVKPETWRRS